MDSHPLLIWLLNQLDTIIALLCFFIGVSMYFFTEKMLDLTTFLERSIGAFWIPSKKTYDLYRQIGIFFLCLGSALLGYSWHNL